jgi:hypothetical protein
MSAPAASIHDAERLVSALEASADWTSAADLALALYGSATPGNKRRVRVIARAVGDGIVSFPGSPGYKLWQLCTVDELHRCVAAWESQTVEMRHVRDLYRRRLYRQSPATFREDPTLRPTREQLTLL